MRVNSPFHEFALMKQLLAEAQKRTGVTEETPQLIPHTQTPGPMGIGRIPEEAAREADLPSGLVLVYRLGITCDLERNELLAMIAHELGHLHYGDINIARPNEVPIEDAHMREYRADAFAAKHYGHGSVIAGFERFLKICDDDPRDTMHPKLADRIARLRDLVALPMAA